MLVWPLASVHVTSGFSLRRWHPVLKVWKMHTGVDLQAPWRTPVLAAGDGTVEAVGWDPPRAGGGTGAGLYVRLRHASTGVTTRYYHLSRLDVLARQEVRAGEVIGLVGSTGDSTGPHLHFEVRVWGVPVDPVAWLTKRAAAPAPPAPPAPTRKKIMVVAYCAAENNYYLIGELGVQQLGCMDKVRAQEHMWGSAVPATPFDIQESVRRAQNAQAALKVALGL